MPSNTCWRPALTKKKKKEHCVLPANQIVCCDWQLLQSTQCAAASPSKSLLKKAAAQNSSVISPQTHHSKTFLKYLHRKKNNKKSMYVFVFSSILSVNHECMHFHTYQVVTMEWEAGIFSDILCVVTCGICENLHSVSEQPFSSTMLHVGCHIFCFTVTVQTVWRSRPFITDLGGLRGPRICTDETS